MIARNEGRIVDAGIPAMPRIVRPGENIDRPIGQWLNLLSHEGYHADKEALSRSGVVAGRKSPAHFLAKWNAPPSEPTAAMAIGTLTHMAVLEPDIYRAAVVVQPEFSGEGMKKRKADWLASQEPGAIAIKADDKALVDGMATSLRAHPIVRELLKRNGLREASGYWVDAETGILCRCRPDIVLEDGTVPDIKTTLDASPDGFARTIVQHAYHIQPSHYLDGVQAIQGSSGPWLFLAVEKEPPYACAVYVADEAMIARGRAERARVMRSIRHGIETGEWPAYGNEARTISLPQWALTSPEELSL